MIRRLLTLSTFSLGMIAASGVAFANVSPGQSAPDFSLTDITGKEHKLSDFKGKYVVLEWSNFGCPFVQKHYNSNNMQSLQKDFTAKQVVWLTINSTNASHQDYRDAKAMQTEVKNHHAMPTAYLLDSDGKVGNLFGAKTTPHMYVIDPSGKVIYAGAIDDKRSASPEDVKGATNYVKIALDSAMSGKSVSVASTAPYGCSVKYP